ncbi:ATP-binding protein [Pelosinus sp. sgz500959]|uniref:ATP-binding protein n=1 Tax=Pelosinus sp. sgz500959 TaxID=3242472 RepID=UPI0036706FC7
MQMLLYKLIGDESLFSAEHRIFNIVLLIGILLSISSGLMNYFMNLSTVITMIILLNGIVLGILYYISIIKKQYSIPVLILIFMCVFILTPSIWIFNGGILGGASLYILIFASMIAALLRGFKRLVLLGCLVIITLILVIVEYKNPSWITYYTNDVDRYIDVSFGLLCTMLANATFIMIIINYYTKEYDRSRDYLAQIEKQKIENAINKLERLNLIGEMAASIGHEIRNPLTTVRGYLQYFTLKKEFSDYKESFIVMIQELDRSNLIITEFLSLAKNKKVDLKLNNLNIIISQIYPLIQADAVGAGKNITLELGEIPNILIDENEIKQYILNLVRNALEAIKYKGIVSIKTYMDGQRVVLDIQDNGEGIPQEVIDKLGTPFVTTKDHGTGIGIPICYKIAERHKAQLDMETSSRGTKFSIKFRLLEQA